IEIPAFNDPCNRAFNLPQQARNARVHCGAGSRFWQSAERFHRLYTLIKVQRRTRLQCPYRQISPDVNAFVFVASTQSVEYEFEYRVGQASRLDLGTERIHSERHGVIQIKVELLVDQDAQHAECSTTQGIRVFATGR